MPEYKSLEIINVGTTANDGSGDLLRDAFVKVNNNANAIYNNGQFVAYNLDSTTAPGYTWATNKTTGMYLKENGTIAFSLNGTEYLVLNKNGEITWGAPEGIADTTNYKLATLADLDDKFSEIAGGIDPAITLAGIPQALSLPISGNYEGRIILYNGDVWIFTGYPEGNGTVNGVRLADNPTIARFAANGIDNRWVRFRGDLGTSVGSARPSAGFEGQLFYDVTDNILYFYIRGAWRTAASVFSSAAAAGIEVVSSLPIVSDPDNFSGRTVLNSADDLVYVFVGGAWESFADYLGAGAGAGILSGEILPSTASASTGELFRKTGTSAGLYIFDGTRWTSLTSFITAEGLTSKVIALPALPDTTATAAYAAGSLISVANVVYRLNDTKTAWNLFNTSGSVSISIAPGSIGSNALANLSITNIKLVGNTISGDKIVESTLTSRELSSSSVISDKIAANAVTSGKIAYNSVTQYQLAPNAVTSAAIAPLSITAGKLASGSITADKISAANISSISDNLGNVNYGALQSKDGKMIIDLNNKILRIEI